MKRFLVSGITAMAMTLLALARWLDGGNGSGSRRSARSPKPIDLPRSHYRFSHIPPGRWQVIKTGLAIVYSSLCFAVSSTRLAGAGA